MIAGNYYYQSRGDREVLEVRNFVSSLCITELISFKTYCDVNINAMV